jgi:transposase
MRAYSEDLRRKVVEAARRGMGKSEAARTFGVSLSSVKRYVSKALEGASLSPREHPGPQPKIDERARRLLEADLEGRLALSLNENDRFPERVSGVRVSESTMSRLLRRLGISRRKGLWMQRSETRS